MQAYESDGFDPQTCADVRFHSQGDLISCVLEGTDRNVKIYRLRLLIETFISPVVGVGDMPAQYRVSLGSSDLRSDPLGFMTVGPVRSLANAGTCLSVGVTRRPSVRKLLIDGRFAK
jgi:hypothetical protein